MAPGHLPKNWIWLELYSCKCGSLNLYINVEPHVYQGHITCCYNGNMVYIRIYHLLVFRGLYGPLENTPQIMCVYRCAAFINDGSHSRLYILRLPWPHSRAYGCACHVVPPIHYMYHVFRCQTLSQIKTCSLLLLPLLHEPTVCHCHCYRTVNSHTL